MSEGTLCGDCSTNANGDLGQRIFQSEVRVFFSLEKEETYQTSYS